MRSVAPPPASDIAVSPGPEQIASSREHFEVGPRLLKHAREGWPLLQAREVACRVSMRIAERHHLVGVEKRRGRRAIGHGELFAGSPGSLRHLALDHSIRQSEAAP